MTSEKPGPKGDSTGSWGYRLALPHGSRLYQKPAPSFKFAPPTAPRKLDSGAYATSNPRRSSISKSLRSERPSVVK